MARCTKCSYLLVLLPKRNKYKCSKCGSLFSQKGIDNKEFREWNKRQRIQDLENIKPERKPRIKLSEEERKRRAKESAKRWRENNKEKLLAKQRENYWKNHEKELERCRIYRENNKEKKALTNKKWLEKNKEHYKQWLKTYLEKNRGKDLLKKRLSYWRAKQKALALRELENIGEKAYNADIFISPPTSVHYHLL